jgi:large subunit ribosomal protein L14e
MTQGEFEVGRVVLAKAGRDKGKAFIIIQRLDDEYVLIADGAGRTIDKPKKKKIKHLKACTRTGSGAEEMLKTGAGCWMRISEKA